MHTQFSAGSKPAGFLRRKMAGVVMAGALLITAGFVPAAAADWYVGVNTGPMLIDAAGVSDPTNAGVMIGHEWGVVLGDVGVQGEFTSTIDEGSLAGNEVSVSTQAVYGVFRTAGALYLIAKAGVLREEVEIGGASDSDSGGAMGLGVGFSLGVAQLELEYTQVEQDIAYLSLGVRF